MAKQQIDKRETTGSTKRPRTKRTPGIRVSKAIDPEVAKMVRNISVPLKLTAKHGARLSVEMRKAVQ